MKNPDTCYNCYNQVFDHLFDIDFELETGNFSAIRTFLNPSTSHCVDNCSLSTGNYENPNTYLDYFGLLDISAYIGINNPANAEGPYCICDFGYVNGTTTHSECHDCSSISDLCHECYYHVDSASLKCTKCSDLDYMVSYLEDDCIHKLDGCNTDYEH